jgi:L-malate glycosyltransferase
VRLLLMHPWAGLPSRQALYQRLQDKTGWDLMIVTAARWRDDYGRMVEAHPGPDLRAELVALPVGLTGNIPLHYFRSRLRPHIRAFDPDCVYIYHEPYAAATWQMLRAAKAVTNAPVGVRSAQNIVKRYPLPFRQMEREVYRRSDFAVVVTDNVAQVLRDKGYTHPISIIPMPVDLAIYRPAERPPGPETTLRVGFVGRLVPEKGIDTAIQAVAMLPAGTASLTVVGDGPQRSELERMAGSLDASTVTFCGSLDQASTAAAYQDLDVVVVPSRSTPRWTEQFGRVVIEAAASGIPVIVTRSGELPFLVSTLGSGWVIEEGDAAGLADLLRRFSLDRAALRAAGAQARAAVIARYSDDAVVAQLIEAFTTAARRS